MEWNISVHDLKGASYHSAPAIPPAELHLHTDTTQANINIQRRLSTARLYVGEKQKG